MAEKYELVKFMGGKVFKKDGHTMIIEDVLMDLKRKSHLEDLYKIIIELEPCIKYSHVDMGGKDRFIIGVKSFPVIKKLKAFLVNQ